MPTPSHHHPRGGFTLIELAVVIVIVAAVAAVAFPRLIPILAYSELEGSARHAAQFGRAALGEAAMLSKELTIRIDLD